MKTMEAFLSGCVCGLVIWIPALMAILYKTF